VSLQATRATEACWRIGLLSVRGLRCSPRSDTPREIVYRRFLLGYGANLKSKHAMHGTTVILTYSVEHIDSAKLLVRIGAGLLYQDNKGETFSALSKAGQRPWIAK
jgi:hypothetical protein